MITSCDETARVAPSFLTLPVVAVFLLVCFQLIQDMMQEVVFLFWEIHSIETGERQGGRRKKVGSC